MNPKSCNKVFNNPIKILFSIILYMAATLHLTAQSKGVNVLGSARQDAILLRWAPTTPEVWRLGNRYGYQVERYTVLRDDKIPENVTGFSLLKEPLRPKALEMWEPHADDKYVAIAAECLFDSHYKGISSGGNPHIVYRKYQDEQHRYSFALFAADQSLLTAELSGLYLADETASPNEKYLYRVFVNCPDSLAVDTGSVFTGLSEYQPLPRPPMPAAKWEDKKVLLSWNTLYLKHIYNSYVLERSTDGGNQFERVSDNALVQLTDQGVQDEYMYRTDTLPDNRTVNYYRVRGISPFGELGPPSDSIFGSGRLPISSPPVVTDKQVVENKSVVLTWDYPDEMNPYITGFRVYRSSGPNDRKKVVLSGTDPQQRTFTDVHPDMTNYYLVSVYNQDVEKVSSTTYAARVDSFPPSAPRGLTGTIDSAGVVTLRWLANQEKDLEGYRLFVSNHPSFEFILATPSAIKETLFRDSINIRTLTRNIYYKVAAIDVRQNQSALSEAFVLQRPDVIPPVAPRLVSVSGTKERVELEWVNSSSMDVAQHHVYRKAGDDTTFIRVAVLPVNNKGTTIYNDPLVEGGASYSYYVVAQDESGLLSPASNQQLVRILSDAPESISLKFIKRIDHVVLQWEINTYKKVARMVVYRSVNDGPMRLYGNSEGDEFTDRVLSPGKKYSYRVNALYDDGSSSPMSQPAIVKL